MTDNVNSPAHYKNAAATLEPIDVLRHAPFCFGNVLKYILRAGGKGDPFEDIAKARRHWNWEWENIEAKDLTASTYLRDYGYYLRLFPRLKDLNSLADVDKILNNLEQQFEMEKCIEFHTP